MDTVIYLRVITHGEVLDGYGLDVKEHRCPECVERADLDVVAVVRDAGLSGTLAAHERPRQMGGLAMLSDGLAEALVVAGLDCLARAQAVQEVILAETSSQGAELNAADVGPPPQDDPDGPM